jgi:hypothetical protein
MNLELRFYWQKTREANAQAIPKIGVGINLKNP